CIRIALTTGFPARPTFVPSSSENNMQTCRVFQFGVNISKVWRQAKRAFTDNTREFWETVLDKLRSFEVELPELRFLIKYYEVLFPFPSNSHHRRSYSCRSLVSRMRFACLQIFKSILCPKKMLC